MFERYTERARRVLFFARYETTQLGSNLIETEHLLLGKWTGVPLASINEDEGDKLCQGRASWALSESGRGRWASGLLREAASV